jgi:hypothetical protein
MKLTQARLVPHVLGLAFAKLAIKVRSVAETRDQ